MTEDPHDYVKRLFGTDEPTDPPAEPTTPAGNYSPAEGQPLDPGAGEDVELREFTRALFDTDHH